MIAVVRVAALLFAVAALVAGCGDEAAPKAAPASSSFAAAAERAVAEVGAGDAVLLDVRTDEEVAAGRAPGAVHLPLARIEAGARPALARDAAIHVYCRTGRRAAVAVRALRADGYTDVTNIGGLADWERAGGRVTRPGR